MSGSTDGEPGLDGRARGRRAVFSVVHVPTRDENGRTDTADVLDAVERHASGDDDVPYGFRTTTGQVEVLLGVTPGGRMTGDAHAQPRLGRDEGGVGTESVGGMLVPRVKR